MTAMTLQGKVVWVTGASSGIGQALARELAERGARLVLSARRRDRLEALRAACPDPDRIHVLPMDVSDTDAAEERVRDAGQAFGRVDVMVHNAGVGQRSPADATPLSRDRAIMEVNYFGVVALTKALLPQFTARRAGHFVVVSSVTGYVGTPLRSAYAASKHALHGFFESLRAEQRRKGIRVSLVCPGFVRTELRAAAYRAEGSSSSDEGERGISAERCAKVIANVVERPRAEVYVGGPEVGAIYLRRFAPSLLRQLLRRIRAPAASSNALAREGEAEAKSRCVVEGR